MGLRRRAREAGGVMERVRVIHSDCLLAMRALYKSGERVDSVVTDPPYHLHSIVKRFSRSNPDDVQRNAPARKIAGQGTSPHMRAATGFMGKTWDGGDVAFDPETWHLVFDLMKPGAYAAVFSGSRTFDLTGAALRAAGFIMHPFIAWIFATGFPKAHKVHAEGWEGWRYGGQALKPAIEPILIAQKPMSEKTGTTNVLKHGTGAINVDGCRVGDNPGWSYPNGRGGQGWHGRESLANNLDVPMEATKARWPANLVHDGSDEVIAAFPHTASRQDVAIKGESAAERSGNSGPAYGKESRAAGSVMTSYGDEGSAARFFFAAKPDAQDTHLCLLCDDWYDRKTVCDASNAASSSPTQNTPTGATAPCVVAGSPSPAAKATPKPKKPVVPSAASLSSPCHPQNASGVPSDAPTWDESKIAQNAQRAASLCGSCATAIARSLASLRAKQDHQFVLTQASISEPTARILSRSLALYVAGRENTDIILTIESLRELFGSVSSAIAASTSSAKNAAKANFAPDRRRFHFSSKADQDDRHGSAHPTVKPIDLMRWLCRLVTPPKGLILDPFAGTGTTGIAAWAEGFSAILIEREAEYIADIHRRLEWAQGLGPDRLSIQNKRRVAPGHGPLFEDGA